MHGGTGGRWTPLLFTAGQARLFTVGHQDKISTCLVTSVTEMYNEYQP
jgi:hypothetical protein